LQFIFLVFYFIFEVIMSSPNDTPTERAGSGTTAAVGNAANLVGKIKRRKRGKQRIMNPNSGFNLAGRVDRLKESGIKQIWRESVGLHDSSIDNDLYWQFKVITNRGEWVRFFPDSVTVQTYGNYNNPADTRVAGGVTEPTAMKHSLRAQERHPFMFVDPTTMGTCFVKEVEVIINGSRVPTNSLNQHLLQYSRMCGIFAEKPRPFFATTADITMEGVTRANMKFAMRQATLPFDYGTAFNSRNGSRIPVYLDGKFPFDFKNRTLETIDREPEPTLYLPPSSEIIIKVILFKDKIEGIFHDNTSSMTDYLAAAARTRPTGELALTFQSVRCEFEKVILTEAEHISAMAQFVKGNPAIYDYDIPRSQFQAILNNQSFTVNHFHIPAKCRLLYILFLPSWATFVMETTHKPLSGFSKFPHHCTRMNISFAGEKHVLTESFEKFGDYDETHQLSKKTLYDYYKERRIATRTTFDDFFPRTAAVESLIQAFVIDTKHWMSERTEQLTIEAQFDETLSPTQRQILVFSVHPTGRAIFKYHGEKLGWESKFEEL
jgi:hypothetical protein